MEKLKKKSLADVVAQRSATLDQLDLAKGQTVIDIGCGPGFLCESMAEIVGSSGRVVGIDISADLVALSKIKSACRRDEVRQVLVLL